MLHLCDILQQHGLRFDEAAQLLQSKADVFKSLQNGREGEREQGNSDMALSIRKRRVRCVCMLCVVCWVCHILGHNHLQAASAAWKWYTRPLSGWETRAQSTGCLLLPPAKFGRARGNPGGKTVCVVRVRVRCAVCVCVCVCACLAVLASTSVLANHWLG